MAKSGVLAEGQRGPAFRCAQCGLRPFVSPPEDCARPLELRGRVDAERHAVDDGRVDAHPRFERAQLLEFFALLEWRRRQRPETGERGAAKGVKADVMIERPLAG